MYSHLCCANVNCRRASPALGLCAELGLQLAWVAADNDCLYHAVLHDEFQRPGRERELNKNSSEYLHALLSLRGECAKQLTASDMRTGSGPLAQQARKEVAKAARHQRMQSSGCPEPPLQPADYAAGAIDEDRHWDAYHRHIAALKGKWADGEMEGFVLAAKLRRSIATLHWAPPADGGTGAGGLRATVCQFHQGMDEDDGEVSIVRLDGTDAQFDMAHPALAPNPDEPDQEPLLLWYNGTNHYWAVRRTSVARAETGIARALWLQPGSRFPYREANAASTVAPAAGAPPPEQPPQEDGQRRSSRTKRKSSRLVSEFARVTLPNARGQRDQMLQEFADRHSLHAMSEDEWPLEEIEELARTINGGHGHGRRGRQKRTFEALQKVVRKQRAELCAEQRTEFEWSEGACRLCGHCGAKIHPVSTTTKKYRKWGWWKNSSKSSSSGAAPTAEDDDTDEHHEEHQRQRNTLPAVTAADYDDHRIEYIWGGRDLKAVAHLVQPLCLKEITPAELAVKNSVRDDQDRGIGWAFDENYDEKVVSGMWCCRHGTQVKPKLPDLPPEFVEIFTRLLLVKNKNGEERRPYFDRLSRYVNNQFAFSALGIDDGEQAQRRQTAETSGEPRQSGFVQTGRTATGNFLYFSLFCPSRQAP